MNEFEKSVWKLVMKIPLGYVSTYGDIASALGNIGYSRLVGKVMSSNSEPITKPCHRVVYSDGRVGWYMGIGQGSEEKIELLRSEGIEVNNHYITNFEKHRFKHFFLDRE